MKIQLLLYLFLIKLGFVNCQQVIDKSSLYKIDVTKNKIESAYTIVYGIGIYKLVNKELDTIIKISLPSRDSVSFICFNDSIISFLISDRYQPELISYKKIGDHWNIFFYGNQLHPEKPERGFPNPSFNYSLLDVDIIKAIVSTYKDPNIKFEHIYRADFTNPRKKGYFELRKEAKGIFKDIKYEYKYILISNKKHKDN